MRLIDADKINFSKVFIGNSDFAKDTREAAQGLIDSQPTAYDVDKVVEELKRNSMPFMGDPNDRDVDLNQSIEIVKAGGARD